jgi:hypothetical protein
VDGGPARWPEILHLNAIGDRLSMARKTVEAHIAIIFSKLKLAPASDDPLRPKP